MPHLLHHHLISHHLHYTEINEVYISQAARAFGLSLIGIFIPIYLYNLGYDLGTIALFFIITHSIQLFVTPMSGPLLARFGAKHLMAFGQLWTIIFITILTFAHLHPALVLLTALAWGVDTGIFWPAYHYNLSRVRTMVKTSRQIGVVFILLSVAQGIGPLMGGIIATQFGIHYTFLAAMGLLLIAAYVYMQTPDHSPRPSFNWQNVWHGWRGVRRDVIANAANGLQAEVALYVWPLFIFLFLGTYQTVGLVISLSLVVSILVIYIIARRGDQGKNRQQLHLGSKSASLVYLARPFAQTFGSAAGINIIHEVTSNLYRIPFMSYYYDRACTVPDRLAYIIKMEMAVSVGLIISWLAVVILALVLPLKLALIGAFIFAAIAILFNTKIAPHLMNRTV